MSFPFSPNSTDGGVSTPPFDSFGGSDDSDTNLALVDPVELAGTTIRNAFRGLQTRKTYSQMSFDHVVKYFNGQTHTLVKHLVQVTNRVQESWRRHLLGQAEQIKALDDLKEIREEMDSWKSVLRERSDEIDADDHLEVEEFKTTIGAQMESFHARLNDVCERVGFHNVKKGLSVIMGEEWKLYLSDDAHRALDEMQLIFTPTAYTVATVEESLDDSRVVMLEDDRGVKNPQHCAQLEKKIPFFRSFRFFEPTVGMDHVHGAEINIPITHEDGMRQVIVMKGYFNNNPVNVAEQIELVGRNRRLVERALESKSAIPEKFRKLYLDQFPIRDIILKRTNEIVDEIEADYQLVVGSEGKILPSFLQVFNQASFDRQIKLFGLLLLQDEPRMAMFLYEMVLKNVPSYVETIRNTLHFSLLRKLDLAIEEIAATRQKLSQLTADDVPYETRIAHSKMEDPVKQKALDKLKAIKKGTSESDKAQKYLDGLLGVPFGSYTTEPVTKESSADEIRQYLNKVVHDLDTAVHGHQKAKDAVLEWVAQRISNGESKGECIALEGPPGNGKTTFAREGIAKALGRPFAFISMGGQTDSAVLVGHGFTYVGSDWGRIIEILREAKCMDPVIYIDEVDKVSQTEKGRELIGVLTALTDFSQNKEFQDKYFSGVKFDLSRALFIFSYNDPSQLDPIFKDRLKVIKTDALSLQDKIIITRQHLLKEILHSCGFEEGEIVIGDEEIRFLVEQYTFEAGARKLKENLFAIVRAINRQRLTEPGSIQLPYKIDRDTIIRFRDQPKIEFKKIAPAPMVGMVNGLYATTAGIGGLTLVQAYKTLANERLGLTLTGSQGDVMKESMTVARSVAWNLVSQEVRDRIMKGPVEGIHIHAPEGATPKDGPSAGGAITTAIVSLLTGVPIRNDVAMTGEIDLTGRISKIGGLAAKLHGAKRAGVKLALCPRDNAMDLEKIKQKYPELINDSFQVVLVDTIHDVLDHALVRNPIPRPPGFAPFTLPPPSDAIEVQEPMVPVDDSSTAASSSSSSSSSSSYRGVTRGGGAITLSPFVRREKRMHRAPPRRVAGSRDAVPLERTGGVKRPSSESIGGEREVKRTRF